MLTLKSCKHDIKAMYVLSYIYLVLSPISLMISERATGQRAFHVRFKTFISHMNTISWHFQHIVHIVM